MSIFIYRAIFTYGKNIYGKQRKTTAYFGIGDAFLYGAGLGVGFLFSDLLLQNGFNDLPITLNALRFSVAAVIVAIIFAEKSTYQKHDTVRRRGRSNAVWRICSSTCGVEVHHPCILRFLHCFVRFVRAFSCMVF